MKDLNQKSYDTVLQETSDYFQANGISIIGRGYEEVASNASLFESYVDQLTEGASADHAEQMAQLMVNTNKAILRESATTGIQPIASLSMPVIRKLWPKCVLKDAIKTEVATTPRFVIVYTAPYMENGDGERIWLPRGLNDTVNRKVGTAAGYLPDALQKKAIVKEATLTVGAAADLDFDYKVTNTPSAIKKQPVDEVYVSDVVYDGKVLIKIGKRLGVYGNGVYSGTFEDTVADGENTKKVTKEVKLIVNYDAANAKAMVALVGELPATATDGVKVTLTGYVSEVYNEESYDVSFDIKREDIDIPTGQHLNASLPVETLQDLNALYQIDGTKETVDLMTNIFSQKLDLEIQTFLKGSMLNQPRNEAFYGYPTASEYAVKFDCKPAAGFAGSPKLWREEIKPLIDHLAQKIMNNTYLQGGMFSIICNPLDAQILSNVDWQYRGGQGGNVDGVNANYDIGTYVGAFAYKVVSSINVPQGAMMLVFTPSADTQMTYKYYPYTFSTEMGYTSPNHSRVPSVMMTKRDTLHEFMPAIGLIAIVNNDGKNHFAQYSSWADVTDKVTPGKLGDNLAE